MKRTKKTITIGLFIALIFNFSGMAGAKSLNLSTKAMQALEDLLCSDDTIGLTCTSPGTMTFNGSFAVNSLKIKSGNYFYTIGSPTLTGSLTLNFPLTGTPGQYLKLSDVNGNTEWSSVVGGSFDSTTVIGSQSWGDGSTDTIVWTWNRLTGTDPTLTIDNGGFTIGNTLQLGQAGTSGVFKLYSEQGANDYTASIYASTAMTGNASFYYPVDEPAASSLLGMTSSGAMNFVTTSAGISNIITDETGSGAMVFGTSPIFPTDITVDGPVIITGYAGTDTPCGDCISLGNNGIVAEGAVDDDFEWTLELPPNPGGGIACSGSGGVGGVDTFTVATANWVTNQWAGYTLSDGHDDYEIISNTSTILVVDGFTLAAGPSDWEIYGGDIGWSITDSGKLYYGFFTENTFADYTRVIDYYQPEPGQTDSEISLSVRFTGSEDSGANYAEYDGGGLSFFKISDYYGADQSDMDAGFRVYTVNNGSSNIAFEISNTGVATFNSDLYVGGALIGPGAPAVSVETVTINYTDLAAAATTKDITLTTLAAGEALQWIVCTTAIQGVFGDTLVFSVGDTAANYDQIIIDYSATQAVGILSGASDGDRGPSLPDADSMMMKLYSMTATQAITLHADGNATNLNDASMTAGQWVFKIVTVQL